MYKFKLYLYLSSETPPSVAAACNLRVLLDKKFKGQYSLEVINILDNPQRAVEDNILATPTLVKASPPPERRVVGDLSDEERVLTVLGLTAEKDKVSK
jgi:circadian clock protein KaiB